MKPDSNSTHAKWSHMSSQFQPYQSLSGDKPPLSSVTSMSSSPTCLIHSDAMICDNPGQMSEVYESDATKSTSNALSATSEVIWDNNSGQMSEKEIIALMVPPMVPLLILLHLPDPTGWRLDANLSNQIELGLLEAFEFTLNLIEWSFIETYQQNLHDVMSIAVKSGQPTKLMPGAREQSISQL
ncbi:hypothetical protein J3A83DRAFT_4186161 [Scleroderma citrinum]